MDLSGVKITGSFKEGTKRDYYYISIKCNTLKEAEDVLDELDKANCVWADHLPLSENREYLKYFPIYLNRRIFTVTFSNYAPHEEMSYDEFMKIAKENVCKSLTIEYDGKSNKVTATDESGNTAEAKCHPDDKFCFSTGARIALNRLLEGLTTKKENPIKAGEKVKFKDKENIYSYAENWKEIWENNSWILKYAWSAPYVLGFDDIYECVVVRVANHWTLNKVIALVKVTYKGSDIPSYYLTDLDNLERA